MRVSLFQAIPEEGRVSTDVYARELADALTLLPDPPELTLVSGSGDMRRAAGGTGRVARVAGYGDRYLRYQLSARRGRADINHVVDHGYGHLAWSLDRDRTVVTFHDAMLLKLRARELPVDHRPTWTILGHIYSLAAIRRVACVIAPSQVSRRDLLRFVDIDPARVVVVPMGVASRFRPGTEADPEVAPDDGEARLLHVGSCAPHKNIEGILRALPEVERQAGRPVRLLKVGGSLTQAQRDLVSRLHVGDRVTEMGKVPDASLPEIYRRASVLVMPSLYEGFGLTVLEAMASGTPVVASAGGALEELVGDAGLLVEPEDTSAIATAVVRAISEPALRARLVAAGLHRAASLGWDSTAAATLAVYRRVAAAAS